MFSDDKRKFFDNYRRPSYGLLTPKGNNEMESLGTRLRKRYIDSAGFLPDRLNVNDLLIRSTNMKRTCSSVDYLLRGLCK